MKNNNSIQGLSFTVFTFLLIFNSTFAQSCLPNGITFTKQSQIDSFPIQQPDCVNIEGDVIISGNDIINVDSLQGIKTLGGQLNINNCPLLSSLNGFNQLEKIVGALILDTLPSLSNLSGFENLHYVQSLSIRENDNLSSIQELSTLDTILFGFLLEGNMRIENLNGLENLKFISKTGNIRFVNNSSLTNIDALQELPQDSINVIDIRDNEQLRSLEGLQNFVYIDKTLKIGNNKSLEQLEGLEALLTIGVELFIQSDTLKNLTGLDQLLQVGTIINISNNRRLTSLAGLDNLRESGIIISITDNPELEDISALGGLINQENVPRIDIENNPKLSACGIPSLCRHLFVGNFISLENNAPGCNTRQELMTSCLNALSSINIQSFYDLNENGNFDPEDVFLPGFSFTINPNALIYLSTSENSQELFLDFGTYRIAFPQSNYPSWDLTSDSLSYQITLDSFNLTDTIYFGFTPTQLESNLTSSVSSPPARCATYQTFDVHANNLGTTIASGTFWFTYDENISDTSFIDPPDTIIGDQTIGWFFTDLYPGQTLTKQISLEIPGPLDFPIGEDLNFSSLIEFEDENGQQTSETFEYATELRCSYDPNDKLVHPNRENNFTLFEEPLLYTIRFQNTGNDVAYDVIIKDTLDDNLDLSTFKVLNSSHADVLTTTINDARILTFDFKNIFLPDSTSDFEGSNGYVSYIIEANEGVAENTLIENTAGIFFDSNPPIVTNTTENIMVEMLPTSTSELMGSQGLRVYPNPTSGLLFIQSEPAMKGIIDLIDIRGYTVKTQIFNSKQQIDLSQVNPGLYVLKVQTPEGVFTSKVLRL